MRSRRPLSGLALATAAGVTAALVVAGTAAAQAPADPFAAFGVLHQGTAPDLAALKINPPAWASAASTRPACAWCRWVCTTRR